MVTVYSGQAAAASGKRTSPLPVNRESGAALASGFLGEYPIHSASAGRAEGHREGCAPACSYGRLPGSLSAPPEMPHRPQPTGPLPVCGCGRRPEGSWPSLAGLHPYSLPGHLPLPAPTCRLPPGPGRGQGDHPPPCGPPISTHPPLKRCLAFPPSQRGQQGAGCGGWTARVQGTEVTAPAALGLKWQSLLLVRSARTSRSL